MQGVRHEMSEHNLNEKHTEEYLTLLNASKGNLLPTKC